MPLESLKVTMECLSGSRGAYASLVPLGWVHAQAYVAATDCLGCPSFLQAMPGAGPIHP